MAIEAGKPAVFIDQRGDEKHALVTAENPDGTFNLLMLTGDGRTATVLNIEKGTKKGQVKEAGSKKAAAAASFPFDALKSDTLAAIATDIDLEGRSSMKKGDLVKALRKYKAE